MAIAEWTFTGPNPIVAYSVGVFLERPLSPQVVREISAAHGRFKRELPRRVEQQALTFQMGSPPGQPPELALSGVVFDKLYPDGRAQTALTVSRSIITYMVAEYTRWVEFWPVAERLLQEVLGPALKITPVQGFVLVANNRFRCTADSPDLASLLRQNPAYLAPHMLRCEPPSHSVHNYSVHQSNPAGTRTDSIVCSLSQHEGETLLDLNFTLNVRLEAVVTSERDLLGDPAWNGKTLLGYSLDVLHEGNKALLREIILESLVAKIPGLPTQ